MIKNTLGESHSNTPVSLRVLWIFIFPWMYPIVFVALLECECCFLTTMWFVLIWSLFLCCVRPLSKRLKKKPWAQDLLREDVLYQKFLMSCYIFLLCICLENGLQMCIFESCCVDDYYVFIVLGQGLVAYLAGGTRLCKHSLDFWCRHAIIFDFVKFVLYSSPNVFV